MYSFTIYMTTACNFRCSYCYEDFKENSQLNEKSLRETLDFIFNYGENEKISLVFLGGEPLLNKEMIYQSIDYINKYYPNRVVKYHITTNGSLVDEDFIEFMRENNFHVRLSFDGNKLSHELNRISKDSDSCYEKILENIQKVHRSQLSYEIRMTIAHNTIPYMFENIRFLHERGLSNIGMIMDVRLNLSEDLKKEFKSQVEKISAYYIQEYDKNSKLTIDQFDGKLLQFLCDFGNCFSMCDAGINNYKIMPNGDIYPCSFLTNNNKFIIGNIHNGVDIQKSRNIAISLFDKYDAKCKGCQIRDFCHGMKCGYMNYLNTGKINVPSDSECYCEQIFYKAVERIVDHYLLQSREKLFGALGKYISYLKENKFMLSKYGLKVEAGLINEI